MLPTTRYCVCQPSLLTQKLKHSQEGKLDGGDYDSHVGPAPLFFHVTAHPYFLYTGTGHSMHSGLHCLLPTPTELHARRSPELVATHPLVPVLPVTSRK
jgi:hypothetical protein